ncbi:UNKNOWN [Stylonychia lemnae]|uniref:Uncharacterized protein n=1 Tax=Stylonychia lemnae TaxID=5949 RepID=A0A078B198_STYLE|nr:UNKNOWN [Stylonychia lemnae]|eukprot:CDW87132.1 UNKNOWN [Stylonychia lemnae]
MFSKFLAGIAESFGYQNNNETSESSNKTSEITQSIDQSKVPANQLKLIHKKVEEKNQRISLMQSSTAANTDKKHQRNIKKNSPQRKQQTHTSNSKNQPQAQLFKQTSSNIMQKSSSQSWINNSGSNFLSYKNDKIQADKQQNKDEEINRCLSPRQMTKQICPAMTQSCKRLPPMSFINSRLLEQVEEHSTNSNEEDIPSESQILIVHNIDNRLQSDVLEETIQEIYSQKHINLDYSKISQAQQLKSKRDSLLSRFSNKLTNKQEQLSAQGTEKTSLNSFTKNQNDGINQIFVIEKSKQATATTTPLKNPLDNNIIKAMRYENSNKETSALKISTQINMRNSRETENALKINQSDLFQNVHYQLTPNKEVINENSSDGGTFFPSNQSNFNYQPKFFRPSQTNGSQSQSMQRKGSISNQTLNNNFTNSTFQNDKMSFNQSPLLKTQISQPTLISIQEKFQINPFNLDGDEQTDQKQSVQTPKNQIQMKMAIKRATVHLKGYNAHTNGLKSEGSGGAERRFTKKSAPMKKKSSRVIQAK